MAQIRARLEQVFGEFIDQASRVFVDALTCQLDDPSKLVPLYATMGKLRLYASNETVVCADGVMSRILEAYYSPNINFETQRIRKAESYDVLRVLSAVAGPRIAHGTGRFGRFRGSATWAGTGPSGLCSGVWSAIRSNTF